MNLSEIIRRIDSDVEILRTRRKGSMAPVLSAPARFESLLTGDDRAGEELKHFKSWAYTAITRIGEAISGQPLNVARRVRAGTLTSQARLYQKLALRGADEPGWIKQAGTELELLQTHPLIDAIADPNDLMVRAVLLRVTAYQFLLTGKAYWWLAESKSPGRNLEIWPIPPSWVTPKHDDDKLFARWSVRPHGTAEEHIIDGADMAYFYNPSPSSPIDAISPLRTIGDAVRVDEHIQRSQSRAFDNGIFPGVMITIGRHPESVMTAEGRPILTRDQRSSLINSIKRVYQNVVRTNEPVILDGMIERVDQFTTSPREMDWVESGKAVKSRITQAYGVNPLIYGEIEGANRAQAFVARQLFCEFVVNPVLELVSQVMTAWVAPKFSPGMQDVVAWFEPCMPDDAEMRLKELALLDKAKAVGRRELRTVLGARHGIPADAEEDDTIVVPLTQQVVPLGLDARELPPPAAPPEPGDSDDDEDMPDDEGGSDAGCRPAAKQVRQQRAISAFKKQVEEIESAIVREAQQFFRVQRAEIELQLRDIDLGAPNVDLVFNPAEWDRRLIETMMRPVAQGMVEGAMAELASSRPQLFGRQISVDDILIDIPQNVRDGIERELADTFAQDYWQKINATTRSGIERAVQGAIDEQLGPREMANRILGVLGPKTSLDRAVAIARTEGTGSINAGHYAAIGELAADGVVTGKTWLAIADSRVRDAHFALNNVTVKPEQNFDVGGYEAPYPGHHLLPAEQRVNCRCVVIGEVPEEPSAHTNGHIKRLSRWLVPAQA